MRNSSNRSTSGDLIRYALRAGYHVDAFRMPRAESCSMMDDSGQCYIGIDPSPRPESLLRVQIAHEIGHCKRGAFYNFYAADDVRGKHERRADEWAIRKLIPRTAFIRAVRRGMTYPYQIAEEFSVTEDFARKAIIFYGEKIKG